MLNITLWVLQALLALGFLAHRWLPLRPPAEMLEQMNASINPSFRIFLGVAEVLAAIGLIVRDDPACRAVGIQLGGDHGCAPGARVVRGLRAVAGATDRSADGLKQLRRGAHGLMMARVRRPAASRPETVRTWFHAVHCRTYLGQNMVASLPFASRPASTLFNGTLQAIVTTMVPITYDRLPASKYTLVAPRHSVTAPTATTRHAAAVPNSAIMNTGVTAPTLIDCMAAMPRAGAIRASARITNDENAKNTPPMAAQAIAVQAIRMSITAEYLSV